MHLVTSLVLLWVVYAFSHGISARADTIVDLELVLAVDISLSMQADEQKLQRDGYISAFRDNALARAIQAGPQGRIAVTYIEWAGDEMQSVIVPWRVVATASDARQFADELARQPISRARMTSISGAMEFGANLFRSNGFEGLRRVIDVSGDGPNNAGRNVEAARDSLSHAGVTINGLPIMVRSIGPWGGYFEIPALDRYYRDCVIGGPGAFALAVRDVAEFATAIRQKLLLEIAGRMPPSLMNVKQKVRVQFGAEIEKYDCLIGEKRWQQFIRERGDDW
ncbi:MAG: DUF1194 domain-containing protein [Hyphomicrobiaceae bacterium]